MSEKGGARCVPLAVALCAILPLDLYLFGCVGSHEDTGTPCSQRNPPGNGLDVQKPQLDLITGYSGESSGWHHSLSSLLGRTVLGLA